MEFLLAHVSGLAQVLKSLMCKETASCYGGVWSLQQNFFARISKHLIFFFLNQHQALLSFSGEVIVF